ncbi:uncharacterized protein LOC144751883 [Ciona intestinalis]
MLRIVCYSSCLLVTRYVETIVVVIVTSLPVAVNQTGCNTWKKPKHAATIGRVLDEARTEICNLEAKNTRIEEGLVDLHRWLNGVNSTQWGGGKDKISMGMQTSFNNGGIDDVITENNALKEHVKNLQEISKNLTEKLVRCDVIMCLCDGESRGTDTVGLITKLSTSSQLICGGSANDRSLDSILDGSNVGEVQRQLCDALEKNARWQSYNDEREVYVSNLLSKYNQTSTQLRMVRDKLAHVTSNPDKLSLEQRRHFDKLLVEARERLESERTEGFRKSTEMSIVVGKFEEENIGLRKDVEHWRSRYEEQRASLATLSANYENERRRSNNSVAENKEKQSQIQILQRQVQLFGEDFRAERKEKELLSHELEFMKKKVEQMQKDNKNKVGYMTIQKSVSFCDVTTHDVIERLSPDYDITPTRRPASPPKRNTRKEGCTETTRARRAPAPPSDKKKSRPTPQITKRAPKPREPRRGGRKRISDNDTLLQCPNCGKEYDIMQHMLLIEHIDKCGD